nr:uncharacterized protein LOC122273218 [Parasteatoda tepidariorum]
MRIHQITWTKEDPFILQARHLSCLLCSPGEWCTHYGIGVINLPVNYSRNIERHIKIKQVYSDCDSFSDTSDENFFGSVAEISISKITTQISPNSYIVVKFAIKKSFKYFIALVLSCDSTDEYTVKFMKKCTANKFVFPAADDIAEVNADDIVDALSQPIMNKREQYIFKDNLDTFVNLC